MPRFESYVQGTPSYVELTTPDQDVAKEFYGPLFGWDFEDVPLGEDDLYVRVLKDGCLVAGLARPATDQTRHPSVWDVYLAVDDAAAVAASVERLGGTLVAGPTDVGPDGALGRSVVAEDPTGARVSFWQAGRRVGSELANEPGAPTWNELVTHDVRTATGFYRDLLGVSWVEVSMADGSPYTCLVAGDREVGGLVTPTTYGVPSYWNVYFAVADVDATVEHAIRLRGAVRTTPVDVAGVGRIAVLADPQGGLFNLLAP